VFVACTALVIGAFLALTSLAHATPFFGVVLSGMAGIALTLGVAVLLLVAAVQMYRLKRTGWWLALAIVTLVFLSPAVTLATLGPAEFYRRAYSAQEVEQWDSLAFMNGRAPLVLCCVMGAICVGYLIWLGRYFKPGGGAPPDRAGRATMSPPPP
jgi:hypothetical protein